MTMTCLLAGNSTINAATQISQIPLFIATNNDSACASSNTIFSSTTSFSDYQLTDNSLAFISQFNPHNWTGDLLAYGFGNNNQIDNNRRWSAAKQLDKLSNASKQRTLLSYNANGAIAFQWDQLSSRQQAAIQQQDDIQTAKQRLQFLRGDRSQEGRLLRKRESLLGDIIHSAPVYVGPPSMALPDKTPFGHTDNHYSDFWQQYKERTTMVYVGANDGALHGFDTATGQERLAYIPSQTYPHLASLSYPNYQHRYFVDLTPTIGDAYFDTGSGADWHTVLVGGLGGGGRGLFALDITDPDNFSEADPSATVLWEFSAEDDPDLGYTFSKPVIALTKDRHGQHRWAAIVGNGYSSDQGAAILFILFLDPNLSDGWTLGADYQKLYTRSTSDSGNGLSSPAVVDQNGDHIADRVYAGDLHGNLWAFELSPKQEWQVAHRQQGQPAPLFTAQDNQGIPQPITVKPAIARHPSQSLSSKNHPNLMVYFGSGKYLNQSDQLDSQTQSFYAVWDTGLARLQPDNLVKQEIETSRFAISPHKSIEIRISTDYPVAYEKMDKQLADATFGWRLDLDHSDARSGERVVDDAKVIGDNIFFTTLTPNNGVCQQGVKRWQMFLKLLNGGTPRWPTVDLDGNLVIDQQDLIKINRRHQRLPPAGMQLPVNTIAAPSFSTDSVLTSHTPGNGSAPVISQQKLATPASVGGRISWRELRP